MEPSLAMVAEVLEATGTAPHQLVDPRDHREVFISDPNGPGSCCGPEGAGGEDRPRRLRDRLFVAHLPPPFPGRQRQDRPSFMADLFNDSEPRHRLQDDRAGPPARSLSSPKGWETAAQRDEAEHRQRGYCQGPTSPDHVGREPRRPHDRGGSRSDPAPSPAPTSYPRADVGGGTRFRSAPERILMKVPISISCAVMRDISGQHDQSAESLWRKCPRRRDQECGSRGTTPMSDPTCGSSPRTWRRGATATSASRESCTSRTSTRGTASPCSSWASTASTACPWPASVARPLDSRDLRLLLQEMGLSPEISTCWPAPSTRTVPLRPSQSSRALVEGRGGHRPPAHRGHRVYGHPFDDNWLGAELAVAAIS